jgi:hypothetical protein
MNFSAIFRFSNWFQNTVHETVLFSTAATCPTNEIDLTVFIDSSDAVSFQSMLSFANQVITEGFNIGSNAVRVAVVQYTYTGEIAISLGQYTDITSLQAAISRISYVQTNQSSLLSTFYKIRDMLYENRRPDELVPSASVLLYLTNRASSDTYFEMSATVSGLQTERIRLVTVGAFEPYDSMRELLSYYYDMILVNSCTLTRAIVNQAIFNACPLKGYSNYSFAYHR